MLSTRKVSLGMLREFLKLESASGIMLIAAATLAMLLANSPFNELYNSLLQVPMEIRVGGLEIAKPILLWINDGLMAVFFFLIGLEVKREVLEGQLSDWSQVALPGIAAVGGMAVPSLIYVILNRDDPVALNGWAIPAATDIAFALGILALLGRRVPESLKIFLLTLAILDDLAAIGIIAIFYTSDLSILSLVLAAITLVILFVMNRFGVRGVGAFVLMGIVLWVLVLKSGVHATLAGVALAFAIPARGSEDGKPLLHQLEHMLHPWVAYAIMPIFAFANAGVLLAGVSLDRILSPVPLGIILGLVVGKPVGIFVFSWVGIKARLAEMPQGAGWIQLLGVASLCGIGFTMSLFIASLAFEHGAVEYLLTDRIGILIASLISALLGYTLLRLFAISEGEA